MANLSRLGFKRKLSLVIFIHLLCIFAPTSCDPLVNSLADKLEFFNEVQDTETLKRDVIYIIGAHEHFVRDACYLVSADTYMREINNTDYGSEKSFNCISSFKNNNVRIPKDSSTDYVINKITLEHSFDGNNQNLYESMLTLEKDIILSNRIKFYILIQVNDSIENIMSIISTSIGSLGDMDRYINSTTVYLIDHSINPFKNSNNRFWRLKEVIEKKKSLVEDFILQINNKINKIENNLEFKRFFNSISLVNAKDEYEHIGVFFIPTELFPHWVSLLYFQGKSKFIEIDINSSGMFLEFNDYYSPKPYFYALVKKLFLQLSFELNQPVNLFQLENFPYLPQITNRNVTARLEYSFITKRDMPFCELLMDTLDNLKLAKNTLHIENLCKRAQFVGKKLGMRDLKYEFANHDSVHVMEKCDGKVEAKNSELNSLTQKDLDQDEICRLGLQYTDIYLTYTGDIFSKDYCLDKLSFHELFYLYFKTISQELNVYKVNDSCIFSGDAIIMKNVLSYTSCKSKIVRAKIAVFQDEIIDSSIKIITPIYVKYNGNCDFNFKPSILPRLETNVCAQTPLNYINWTPDRKFLVEYLIYVSSNQVCVGRKYTISMANNIANTIFTQYNMTTNELIEDYNFFIKNINKTNIIGLELYSFHLNEFIVKNTIQLGFENTIVFQNTLIAYDTLIAPIKAQNNLITDLQGFLMLVDDEIQNLQEIKEINNTIYTQEKQLQKIDYATETYQQQLSYTIDEFQIIANRLGSELQNKLDANSKFLNDLITELEYHEQQAEQKLEYLTEKRKKMIGRLGMSIFFSAVSIVGAMVTVCVPPVGAAMVAAGSIGNAINGATLPEFDTSYQIPSNVLHEFKKIEYEIESSLDIELKSLRNRVIKFVSSNNELSESNQRIINDVENKIKIIDGNRNSSSFSILISAKKSFDSIEIQHRTKRNINNKYETSLQLVTFKEEKKDVIEEGVNSIEKGMEIADKIPSLDEIDSAKKDLEKIRNFKNKIFSEIIPLVISFNAYMGNTSGSLEYMSKPLLMEMNYFMKHKFNLIMYELLDISVGMKSNKDIHRNAEDVHDVLQTMFNIHEEIKNVEHEKSYINLLKELSTPMMSEHLIKDKQLRNFVINMKNGIESVNIYRDIEKLLINLKMWVFPFASKLFSGKNVLSNLNTFETISSANFDTYIEAFKDLKSKIDSYNVEIYKYIDDKLFEIGHDSKELDEMYNFFTWNYTDYGQKINELLEGKEVFLTAKIPDSKEVSANAIKFSSVYLYFTCEDEKICDEFYSNISMKYDVGMSHLGYSQYRCDSNFYTISSERLLIAYRYTPNKHITHQNRLLRKLEYGSILLSPHTPWLFSLTPSEPRYKKDLSYFENKINIHLVGKGQYVKDIKNKNSVCSAAMLDRYYKPDTY